MSGPRAVVWAAGIGGAAVAADWALLDAEETARAGRFHFAADRDRFVRRRAFLRRLLGAECGVDPRRIAFTRSAYGKPALVTPLGAAMHFNQSARADLTLVAVAGQGPLGVDIEMLRCLDDLDAMAGMVLTEREQGELASLPQADRTAAFLRAWSQKEALLKASGDGLMVDPRQIEIAIGAGPPVIRMSHAAGPWSLLALDELAGFAAAFAAPGSDWRVELRRVDAATLGA